MVKRLLLTEDYKITPAGEEILRIQEYDDWKEVAIETFAAMSQFDQWWTIYPATNDFEINGRHFKGSQKKNVNKGQCKEIFDRYVKLKLFLAEDIIRATEYHINLAKELSLKKGENQLTYITNSERYLREKYFEPYIEKSKKKKKVVNDGDYSTEG